MQKVSEVQSLPHLDHRLALRLKEAAAALGVSERTMRELLPTIPHYRCRRVLLIPVRGLREWLERKSLEGHDRVDSAVEEILSGISAKSD
jgi:excisionase family DNA binding protein